MSQQQQQLLSKAPLKRIREVRFSVLSPEEIRSSSVAKIEFPETMDESGLRPRVGGLLDPRLGTIDRGYKCQTCGEGMSDCPGHFGHIELAKPVFHYGFLTKVIKILQSVCFNCGKLKADQNDPKFLEAMRYRDPKARMNAMWNACKGKSVCDSGPSAEDAPEGTDLGISHGGCGNPQPTIRKDGFKLWGTWKRSKTDEDSQPEKRAITASEVLRIFQLISDEDLQKLGLSGEYARPEWMIITVLGVPPPPVRPSISVDGSARSEDDLTYKLAEIIKANSNVRRTESEGAPAHIVTEFESLLQFHVATYMDNNIPGQPQAIQKSGRPVKAIRARLKGKEGRLRGNLMGKRVDFSARTVITGDPNISLDEVGVPRSIAKTLTYPETVTSYNIHKLQELVRNGPNEHPGAKYIIRDTGERIDLRYHKRAGEIPLQYGWRVERHIVDGDVIIFNRQPSLHKMSMMGHRIRVMPYSTFRLNLSVTSPYNADFDGDEMNLHVPQSEETRAEISEICMVPRQIVSPQGNKPVMGIVQDALCAIRKFTKRDSFMAQDMVMNILMWIPEWDGTVPMPAIIKPKPLWSGKQILSMVIPRGINITRNDEDQTHNPPDDRGMKIENGDIVYGIVDKKTVGSTPGGLIHIIMQEKGPEVCKGFFNGVQLVVNYWFLHNGFSIGIGDTIADAHIMDIIQEKITEARAKVIEVTRKAQNNTLEPSPGMTLRETFESQVRQALNNARDEAGRSAEKGLKESNNVKQMVSAGSKGSFINISQMSACVGQQAVEGQRIAFGFKFRTLPHFVRDDYSPESRGFVENSYLRGLTPQEFFFHAMAGREGLIDTAVKTAETGYIQRRLVKALEDVMVKYDGTVRNSLGDIVQLAYGEDGLDGAKVEHQFLETLTLSDRAFEDRYRVDLMDPTRTIPANLLEVGNDIDGDEQMQNYLDEEWAQLVEDRKKLRHIFPDGDNRRALPVNIQRVIQNAQQIFHIDRRKPSNLTPKDIIEGVRQLALKLIVFRGTDQLTKEAQQDATLLSQIHIRSRLATKRVLKEYHFNKIAFEWLLGEIESRFTSSVAYPGEMCGTLAAQSIGEPATQMTLNTFHYAGVSSKNVTLGVPRLKEILNVAKDIKTPSLTIYLNPDISGDMVAAKAVQSQIEHTTLRTVTQATEIHYDPDPQNTIIEEDQEFVEAFFAVPDEEVEANLHRQSPWLLRLILDRAKMLDKHLSTEDVAGKIAGSFQNDMFTIWSEDNADQLVIRCRVLRDDKDEEDQEEDLFLKRVENHLLENINLRGVPGVSRVFLNQAKVRRLNELGEFHVDYEWTLETDGVNLAEVMAIDDVDFRRVHSNSFVEVLQVLGIEATRAALLIELRKVIEFDGSYVNYRHLSLLCDVMTSRGHLMAITRHGINRAETGALMRASFEETVEILLDAAAFGSKDDCRGVSENIMLGQLAPLGTGEFDVLLDEQLLSQVILDPRYQATAAVGIGGKTSLHDGAATPYDGRSPVYHDQQYIGSPDAGAAFSPLVQSGADSPRGFGDYGAFGTSPYTGASPYGAGSQSPGYSPRSPFGTSPTSPGYSPASPAYSPTSPSFGYSPTSPGYSPTSPNAYSPASPAYSPYDKINLQCADFAVLVHLIPQQVLPTVQRVRVTRLRRPHIPLHLHLTLLHPLHTLQPARVILRPAQLILQPVLNSISPTSPRYSPTSPQYSPTSPTYSPTSPQYSPTSPSFSPTSPQMNKGSPASPNYCIEIEKSFTGS
ncbi:DNA-directed RNA polymerase II subunit rpb1 [Neolecta irregularis DAH-3]|uniref:DNA-directed RNA polymerase subunit n=1 Tax=Neolecta irregularis (strain DAH-3) TaxID=1198029 RepID=A0A1U7LJ57_NEOID|nr:DNA-directed RNA polymerase II subunit rpb1 [Neolecta irregularis DAH-3]|eukprot:OLL22690.1 DNA-directed RNA polymerase II subunit rpb1 [Neolecta irregularis DAH-3]